MSSQDHYHHFKASKNAFYSVNNEFDIVSIKYHLYQIVGYIFSPPAESLDTMQMLEGAFILLLSAPSVHVHLDIPKHTARLSQASPPPCPTALIFQTMT